MTLSRVGALAILVDAMTVPVRADLTGRRYPGHP